MIDQPTRHAVVIVGCRQGNKADKFLVREFIQKLRVLNNSGANNRSASGETCDPPIHVGRRGNLKVPTLEVASTEKLPDIWISRSARGSETPCSSNLGVFEGCEDVSQECRTPKDVIIRKGRDGGGRALEALDHLQALVCLLRSKHLDVEKPQLVTGILNSGDILSRCHNENCFGRASID